MRRADNVFEEAFVHCLASVVPTTCSVKCASTPGPSRSVAGLLSGARSPTALSVTIVLPSPNTTCMPCGTLLTTSQHVSSRLYSRKQCVACTERYVDGMPMCLHWGDTRGSVAGSQKRGEVERLGSAPLVMVTAHSQSRVHTSSVPSPVPMDALRPRTRVTLFCVVTITKNGGRFSSGRHKSDDGKETRQCDPQPCFLHIPGDSQSPISSRVPGNARPKHRVGSRRARLRGGPTTAPAYFSSPPGSPRAASAHSQAKEWRAGSWSTADCLTCPSSSPLAHRSCPRAH